MDSFEFHQMLNDVLSADRAPTIRELDDIRSRVAAVGFDPLAVARVGRRATGLQWQGRILTGSEHLNVEMAHYLRHVVAAEEWPPQTTVADYVSSLRSTIMNPTGPVLIDVVPGWPRLTFFGQSGSFQGVGGGDWILVAFDVNYRYWTTGYQPVLAPEAHRQRVTGGNSRWLYKVGN